MLSIIVPTHQRRDLVMRLLKTLAEQGLEPGYLEVIVVADGCSDGTVEAAKSLSLPYRLITLEQPHGGQAAARNLGAERARGDGLLFLDDDVVLERDAVCRLLDGLDDTVDVALCAVRVGDWVPDSLITREQRHWHKQVEAAMRAGAPSFHDIHFVATWVRRSCFRSLGGFNMSYTAEGAWGGEDSELAYRMTRRYCRILCRPDVIATIDCVTDPRVVLRRNYDAGRNDVRLVTSYPDLSCDIFGDALRQSRIRRAIGRVVLRAPFATAVRWPLRPLVTTAIGLGFKGALLYRLWLVALGLEWWRGVIDAEGQDLANSELGG